MKINHDDLMSEKQKKICKYLGYAENLLIQSSTIASWGLISLFAPLVCVPAGITNSAVGMKVCATTAGIKRCKPIIMKKKGKNMMQ